MPDEYFYGATLRGKNASIVWEPPQEEHPYVDLQHPAKLEIKQAVLGPDAAEGEINIVQIETVIQTSSSDIKLPIAILKNGSVNHVSLDLAFPDPVTLTLVEGSGPVYIAGLQLMAEEVESEDENSMSDRGNDSDDDRRVVKKAKRD